MEPAAPNGSSTEAVVHALLALCDADRLYADRYLHRAEALLAPLCSRRQLRALEGDEQVLARTRDALRNAGERADWATLRVLAREASEARARLETRNDLLRLARLVYQPWPAGLAGALAHEGDLGQHLQTLLALDPDWVPFYQRRSTELAGRAALVSDEPAPDLAALRSCVLAATERGAFAEVERLARAGEQIQGRGSGSPAGGVERVAHLAAHAEELARPLPDDCAHRAAALGLGVEVLAAHEGLAACVGRWCREEGAPMEELGDELFATARRRCQRSCPPEMTGALWASLDLLMLRPFLTSARSRYVPWFYPETLLVETFPETAPDAASPLLALLGLPSRRGLSRTTVEDALRRGTAAVCDALRLDPEEFTLACIPFDAYLRLATRHGWGRQPRWTHFDGYQVTRGRRWRALVGGDVRYGGPADLCSLGCDYQSDGLLLRVAVVRRRRLVFHEASLAGP